jgi:hypothetical protein
MAGLDLSVVMTGLDPGIHTDRQRALRFIMDCRVKPGNDEMRRAASIAQTKAPAARRGLA